MDTANKLLAQERFSIHNIQFYWPMFGSFISVSKRDGGSTHLLTIEEVHTLVNSLINQ